MNNFTFEKAHQLEEKWFDGNGHLNVVGYLHYFVETVTEYFQHLGHDWESIEEQGHTIFALQQHLSYLSEIRGTEAITCKPCLIGCDGKRLHFAVLMFKADGTLAATMEQMAIHVDYHSRKSSHFPEKMYSKIKSELEHHKAIDLPPSIGRSIALTSKGAT